MPPSETTDSQISENMTEEVTKRYEENSCSKPEVFQYAVSTYEHSGRLAVIVTSSACVAESLAWKIDVTVRVSSDHIEEKSPARAFIFTEISCLITASSLVASEQFD